MSKLSILGIPYDNVTISEAVSLAKAALEGNAVSVAVTPNAEIAQLCIEDENVRDVILDADLILPDGAGVILASEILGTPLKEKVAGVELGEKLLALAAHEGKAVYLLGGKPTVAAAAAQKMQKKYPALHIAGTHDGYFNKMGSETQEVLDEINRSGAELLFVCLGAPTQEKWIMANKRRLTSVRLAACLGGSLDVYAGIVKRAPELLIRLRMEWLYRLIKEPRRLPRMMKLPRYVVSAITEAIRNKFGA